MKKLIFEILLWFLLRGNSPCFSFVRHCKSIGMFTFNTGFNILAIEQKFDWSVELQHTLGENCLHVLRNISFVGKRFNI